MKKTITVLAALIISATSFSQEKKKDTTVQTTMSLDDYRSLIYMIEVNIDSKKASKEIIEFLQKNTRLLQPADKPKQPKQ